MSSSVNEFEEVRSLFNVDPQKIIGRTIKGYRIDRYLGHGKIGVVFHASGEMEKESACKVIPKKTLKSGWEDELKKLVKLEDIPQVVQYQTHCAEILPGMQMDEPCVCIFYQFVKGIDLKKYAATHPEAITQQFIENLIVQVLHVFQAMKATAIIHGDLHEGNILVTDADDRKMDPSPAIKVNDFGLGGSNNRIEPTDDYVQLSIVCFELLRKYVDFSMLEGEERFFYNQLKLDFLAKQLTETNPTVGEFVRNPRVLGDLLKSIHTHFGELEKRGPARLRRPFEYLNCEQIGDSFKLLHDLYSRNFPGYSDLTSRTNTILTGPRGCGKTTIFRNLSLKIQLLSGEKSPELPFPYIGIYYHCIDLYFAFPYKLPSLNEPTQRIVTHYFNLAVLFEILDTLGVAEERGLVVPTQALSELQGFLRTWFPLYVTPPKGTSILKHLSAIVGEEKQNFRNWFDSNGMIAFSGSLMGQDFLKNLCGLLRDRVPWMKKTPFFFFLDDYSMPKISDKVQAILNNFIFIRYPELFFKISTESTLAVYPYDATDKMLDENREWGEVIDLGEYFLRASHQEKQHFLTEVVNNRLRIAEELRWPERDITRILRSSQVRSYNELARIIRSGKHITYCGWETVVDLCSGDIADILRLIRDMFSFADLIQERNSVSYGTQDKAMREAGQRFLSKIEAVPNTGRELARIAQAFGKVANHYLRTRDSKNLEQTPPLQAFRLEVRQTPDFSADVQLKLGEQPYDIAKARKHYEDLLKYGVFIREIKGKSMRGEVTPRLYLRRLLIPTFRLTPSKRDSISLEKNEFIMFLTNPDRFEKHMKSKTAKRAAKAREKHFMRFDRHG